MPKKQVINAFSMYMIDFREDQRKKGVLYETKLQVAEAAGPHWATAPPAVRQKYEAKAKAEKIKAGGTANKFTSTGISYAELDAREQEEREAKKAEIQDIRNLVKLKHFDKSIQKEDIFLMDVNTFCQFKTGYLIGEATILRFSLEEGIKDCYHELINPGFIPPGYALDVKNSRIELGLEMPDESSNVSNYIQILANIIDFMKQQIPKSKTLPPIFTMPNKVEPVQDFINQMCRKAAEDESLFRVYNLDKLFFTLINTIKLQDDEGIPTEALALLQLEKDAFKYSPGLGCQHHEENELSVHCTTSRVKRWAFTVLDKTVAIYGGYIPGRHLPADFDIDGFLSYKDKKKQMPGASVAHRGRGRGYASSSSSCNSSVVGLSFDASTTATNASEPKSSWGPKLENMNPYVPSSVEPDFSTDSFPPLGGGRGRGRGILGKFGNMDIK